MSFVGFEIESKIVTIMDDGTISYQLVAAYFWRHELTYGKENSLFLEVYYTALHDCPETLTWSEIKKSGPKNRKSSAEIFAVSTCGHYRLKFEH